MVSWWKKTLLTIAGLTGVAGGAYYLATRRPVPKKKGKVSFVGLHETVEIITDRYGGRHFAAVWSWAPSKIYLVDLQLSPPVLPAVSVCIVRLLKMCHASASTANVFS